MSVYTFTVELKLLNGADPVEISELLLSGGCEDATFAMGKPGTLVLDFTSDYTNFGEPVSINQAISMTLECIQIAHPHVELVSVTVPQNSN